MFVFITVLKAMAAIMITNSHYTGVYPTDLIANGGLLGDVIFFAVSGYCLVNIKQTFLRWYSKRIIRIFPIVWIITTLYIALGFYSLDNWSLADYYLYPTYYHFVASIIVLYVAFYIVMKIRILEENIPKIMLALFIIEILLFIFIYDKTSYHIDNVREPFIRFLFFQSMLLGAYFRKNIQIYVNKNNLLNWLALVVICILYFSSKLVFVKISSLSSYQILNQIVLVVLLYYVLRCFAGIEDKLNSLPPKFNTIISFLAKITLEIYVVQYVIIPKLTFLPFPLNWVLITFTILLVAFILHVISRKIIEIIEKIISKYFPEKITRSSQ
ncbi:hypothetical protein BK120_15850 [Paenibacillus sp. FSL A5-0031]|uniref:acyltransferase family protein n=1 Tax=Paenibacillus sp. FSL A5-0031 TaxID=1920420 RepID=UPI00096F824E|nr:acyltransferase family protein [Paenibacillus sp. FSL A5-0031]OME82143.1 hypothetical protein BK120_15850 [Paenibacillus sp. FSL A5-0031]